MFTSCLLSGVQKTSLIVNIHCFLHKCSFNALRKHYNFVSHACDLEQFFYSLQMLTAAISSKLFQAFNAYAAFLL